MSLSVCVPAWSSFGTWNVFFVCVWMCIHVSVCVRKSKQEFYLNKDRWSRYCNYKGNECIYREYSSLGGESMGKESCLRRKKKENERGQQRSERSTFTPLPYLIHEVLKSQCYWLQTAHNFSLSSLTLQKSNLSKHHWAKETIWRRKKKSSTTL